MTTAAKTPVPPSTEAGIPTLSIKATAAHYRCSEKRIRRLVKAGLLRAELKQGAYGPQYEIEAATLPPTLPTPDAGQGSDGPRVGAGSVIEGLREDLREARDQYGQAMVAVGQLQAVETERKALTARAESLQTERDAHRSEAERLAGEYDQERQRATALAKDLAEEKNTAQELTAAATDLRSRLRLRTWTAAILLFAFLVAVAAAAFRA